MRRSLLLVALMTQTACEPGTLVPVRDAGFVDVGDAGVVDAGVVSDAGVNEDAGVDGGVSDAGVEEDAGTIDAGPVCIDDDGDDGAEVLWARHIAVVPNQRARIGVGRSATAVGGDAVLLSMATDGVASVRPDDVDVPFSGRGSLSQLTIELAAETGAVNGSVVFSASSVGGLLHSADVGAFVSIDGSFFGELQRNGVAVATASVPAEGFFARIAPGRFEIEPLWQLGPLGERPSIGSGLTGMIDVDGGSVVTGVYSGTLRYRRTDTGDGVDLPPITSPEIGHFLARHSQDGDLTSLVVLDGQFHHPYGLQPALFESSTLLLSGVLDDDLGVGTQTIALTGPGLVLATVDSQLQLLSSRVLPLDEGVHAILQPWIRSAAAGRCAKLTSFAATAADDATVVIDGIRVDSRAVEGELARDAIVCFDESLGLRLAVQFERGVFRDVVEHGRAHDLGLSRTATGFVAAGGFRGAMTIVDAAGISHRLTAPAPDIVNSFVAFFDGDGVLTTLRHIRSCEHVGVHAVQSFDDGSYIVAGEFRRALHLSARDHFTREIDDNLRDAFIARYAPPTP